jgi:hypothetical protein
VLLSCRIDDTILQLSNSPLSLQLQKLYFQWHLVRNSAIIPPHCAVRKTNAMHLLPSSVLLFLSERYVCNLSYSAHLLSWPELCSSIEKFSESILSDVTHVSFLILVSLVTSIRRTCTVSAVEVLTGATCFPEWTQITAALVGCSTDRTFRTNLAPSLAALLQSYNSKSDGTWNLV